MEDKKEKLMNEKYNKSGCFYLRIEILDFKCKQEVVGDASVGIPALAKITSSVFKYSPEPEEAVKIFNELIKKHMEE